MTKTALIELLRETIASDRFRWSPRIKCLKAVLAKFDPAAEARSHASRGRRRPSLY